MARAGKGDLADYGNVIKDKKESKKHVVPGFSELADNEKINERQEILKQVQESNNDNIHESLQIHEHIHDNFTEQFLKQFSKKITKEDTHTRQTWLIKNDTIKRLERLSKGKRKGFKTELVNQALEIFLHQIEK
ncbi:hypothetical protein [Bacillus wiedmannii]|uniref:hypothetical protein n=1 Tax=Bacillus wiedmannii TaxID=1890302 RepID=UPI000BEDB6F7|nr:hypothetical protein [Bacillus wiedmannii]PDZ42279.1 hypothetical protein CON82_30515 [Bacillus wiedmannii]